MLVVIAGNNYICFYDIVMVSIIIFFDCDTLFVGMTSNTCHVVSKLLICSKKLVLTEQKFCLGLDDWCPCCVCSPRMVKKSLRLKCVRELLISEVDDQLEEQSSKVQKLDEQFDFNATSNDSTRFMEGETLANTVRLTVWAVKTFDDWRKARNETVTTDLCPENVFTHEDSSIICQWLCKFITEVRKTTGQEYTPHSLYLILSGLQRHM